MTRDELENRIKYTLGLQDDTTFSETEYVQGLIFQAITDIAARTRPATRVHEHGHDPEHLRCTTCRR